MKPETARLAALCAVIDQDEKLGRLVRDWRSAHRGLKEALTKFRNLLLRQVEEAEE